MNDYPHKITKMRKKYQDVKITSHFYGHKGYTFLFLTVSNFLMELQARY
jgi:hypothetical protein